MGMMTLPRKDKGQVLVVVPNALRLDWKMNFESLEKKPSVCIYRKPTTAVVVTFSFG